MTSYAGEEYKITAVPKDHDGTVLGDTQVSSVTVSIWGPAAALLVDEEQMTFDPDTDAWFWMWDTDGDPFGNYNIKVTVTGLDLAKNWEWKRRFRLAKDPVPVP